MADIDDPIVREYVNSNDINMAIASDIAYKHAENLASSSTKQEANAKTDSMIEERLNFHDLVPTHSNEHVTTIRNVMNDEYIMAVRGTNPKNIHDLASDAQILFNQNVNRVDSVEKIYKSFRQEQPTAKLTLTGHSLGAYVAHTIANKYNEPFVGFDLPSSPLGIISDTIRGYHHETTPNPFSLTQRGKRAAFMDMKAEMATGRAGREERDAEEEERYLIQTGVKQAAQRQGFMTKKVAEDAMEYAVNESRLSAGNKLHRNPEHHVYLTEGLDLVSVLTKYTNVNDNVKILPQQQSTSSLLGSHSIKNYIYNNKPHSTLVRTASKKNTYYSMPHMATSRQTAKSVPVDVNKFYKPQKTRRLRTGYENECLTNPYLNKCKQLNERKFY
jgi:hypothetical protein